VGLDYESFINSSFLRQGQSNEFSKKSPKERKEILATMFGLQKYENIRKLALEKARNLQLERENTFYQQTHLEELLKAYAQVPVALNNIHETLAAITQEESNYNKQMQELHFKRQQLQEKNTAHQLLLTEYNRCKQEYETLVTNLLTIFNQWRATHRQYIAIRQNHDINANLIEQLTHYQKLMQERLAHQERLAQLKLHEATIVQRHNEFYQQAINNEHITQERIKSDSSALQTMRTEIDNRIQTLRQEIMGCEQKKQLLEKESQTLAITEFAAVEKRLEKRTMMYHRWITRGQALKGELVQLEQKKMLTQDMNNPSCPLCEQNLSASRKRFLQTKIIKQQQFLEYRLKRLGTVVRQLKQAIATDQQQLEEYKERKEIKERYQIQQEELAKLQEKLRSELTAAEQSLHKIAAEITNLELQSKKQEQNIQNLKQQYADQLNANAEYIATKNQIQALENQLLEFDQNSKHYTHLVQTIDQLQQKQREIDRINQERMVQPERAKNIHTLCAIIKERKQYIKQLAHQIQSYKTYQQEIAQLHEEEQGIANALSTLKQKREALLLEKGKLEEQQRLVIQEQANLASVKQKLSHYQEELDTYQLVAQALGKDGIQALLIEDALPEIEHAANELLAQLTNNQAHIIIESLRDLKKGGTRETLDIKISDPLGIRAYELFSGGEAFRIDFALRIAISKLLARRAGTSLQTLIIDEGFGSQDEEGIAHMMDALYKIQDHFAKIIIVSHLPAMKEQFPVQFFVTKGPHGSVIDIVQH
jgi:exonuclease SbcC